MLFSSLHSTILKTIPLPFLIVNEAYIITEINANLLSIIGFDLSEVIQQPVEIILPEFRLILQHKSQEFETHITLANQQKQSVKVRFEALESNSTIGIVYFTSLSDPITKESIEDKFELYKNRLRLFDLFLDTTIEGVYIANKEGQLIYSNKTALKFYNIKKSQFKKVKIWELNTLFSSKKDWIQYTQILENSPVIDFEYTKEDPIDGSLCFYSIKLVVRQIESQIYYIFKAIDISEKIKNNYTIQEKEDQLTVLTKNIPGVLFQLIFNENKQSYLTYINERIVDVLGFNLPINNTSWDAKINLHPDDSVRYFEAFNAAQLEHKEFKFSGRLLLNDGLVKWIEVNALPSKQNNILYYNGIIQDVTGKKESELELQIKRQFNDSILNNIPADIAVFDKYHNYLFVNENGIANEDTRKWLIGKNDFDYCELKKLNPASAQQRREYFNDAIANERTVDWIDSYQKGDSKEFVFRRFYPYMLNGKLEYVIGYGIDVTELKNAEELIIKNEQRNSLILNSSLDAILMIDSRGIITFWNPQAETIFGWKADEVIGSNIAEVIIPSGMKSSHQSGMDRFMSTGISTILNQVLELTAINKAGLEFPVELTVVPINDNINSIAFCAYIRDISVRKNKEKQIFNQNKKLKVQNKQLEQFTYIASHDLQEPLLTLTSFSELLLEEHSEQLNDEGKLFVEFINKSAMRMRALVSGLMDYARIGKREKVEEIDCNVLLENVIKDLSTKIALNKATITVDPLPTIQGYSTYMRLLFQNIISNAIKFNNPGVDPTVHIQFSELEEEWLFTVTDNGIGIGKKHQEEIFTIFKRLNHQEQYEGHGIGLSHCKKIVDLHEGDLWVDSQVGQGSAFSFTISKSL
ncbi:MAG: PAS domain S-box protein [Flavobacterium psychrophilum]